MQRQGPANTIDREAVLTTLRRTFGHASFRPLQEEIVTSILQGRDVLALMPTGGGKSLCYQLPALLLPGLTLAISPLIALMKDQVDQLEVLGVPATFTNSSLDPSEITRRALRVSRGEVKLLYVAPERLVTSLFQRLLSTVTLSFVAVDEAHCISEWGHDFRPEYRELAAFRRQFPDAVWGAFTATATPRVQDDIRAQLRLDRAATFQGSFNRPNLYYDVRPKADAFGQLLQYLRERPDSSGIVYCTTRRGVDELAAQLRRSGVNAIAYHAGLPDSERDARQEAFRRDDARVIVATVAFGMGIDKPDVRFVVHYDTPQNLERYYQESGRAGRDGEPADCILFYSVGDLQRHRWFIDQKESESERRVALGQLEAVARWAEGGECRRAGLLAYFDEELSEEVARCCDGCDAPAAMVDYTVAAQKFLSCVFRTGQRFGAAYITQVLRGSRAKRILDFGHDRLSTYGIGRDVSEDAWRHLARELVKRGYLKADPERFNALRLTERARDVLYAGATVRLARPIEHPTAAAAADGAFHRALFDRLAARRKAWADLRGVPPYVVFHDRTLRAIAAALPATDDALLALPGMGLRRVEEYGEAVRALVADFVEETGATPFRAEQPPPRPRRQRAAWTSTVQTTLDYYAQGMSIDEIAAERGLVPGTVGSHLAQAIEQGAPIDLDALVPVDTQRRVAEALDAVGWDALAPIMEYLGGDVSYNEIKLARAALRRQRTP